MQQKDVISEIIGDWGKWQLRAVLLIFLCKIPSAWFMACLIFTAPVPKDGEFFCKPPDDLEIHNISDWIHTAHPKMENGIDYDYCNVYEDVYSGSIQNNKDSNIFMALRSVYEYRQIIPCKTFEHRLGFESLVTQFDLVCSREILIAVTQFFHLFGVLTGGILATKLLEVLSPRKVMLLGMITQVVCGILTGYANNFELHVFFRYLSAVCCAQMYTAGIVIFSDITGGTYKTWVTCLFENFWSIGVILLPGIAFLLPNWTYIYLAISLPTVGYMVLWYFIPDSPRWLIKKGLVGEAKKVLLQSVAVNDKKYKVPIDLDYRLQVQAAASMKEPLPAGWWSLWDGPKNICYMIAAHLAWAIYVTNYNGLLINVKAFDRDFISINTVVFGISEISGVLFALFLILKTKRKWLWTGTFNIIAGFVASAGFLIPTDLSDIETVSLQMLTAVFTKSAVSCSQAILFTCTIELVPPEKRKICMFSCIVWARFWLLTAPFIGVFTYVHQVFPLSMFGLLGAIGGFSTSILSSNRTIPKKIVIHSEQLPTGKISTIE